MLYKEILLTFICNHSMLNYHPKSRHCAEGQRWLEAGGLELRLSQTAFHLKVVLGRLSFYWQLATTKQKLSASLSPVFNKPPCDIPRPKPGLKAPISRPR